MSKAADGSRRGQRGCGTRGGCALSGGEERGGGGAARNGAGDAGRRKVTCLVCFDDFKLSDGLEYVELKNGETVEALNEKTYTLDDTMTVIADDAGVHDIAGIMGGEHSGAGEDTSDVLLEIAYFDPTRIGVTGRKLGLASDARTRFERSVPRLQGHYFGNHFAIALLQLLHARFLLSHLASESLLSHSAGLTKPDLILHPSQKYQQPSG